MLAKQPVSSGEDTPASLDRDVHARNLAAKGRGSRSFGQHDRLGGPVGRVFAVIGTTVRIALAVGALYNLRHAFGARDSSRFGEPSGYGYLCPGQPRASGLRRRLRCRGISAL